MDTTGRFQHFYLLLVLDVFGDNVKSEFFGKQGDVFDDVIAARIVGHFGDEKAIQLDDVKIVLLQINERGVPHREIINGQMIAEIFDLPQPFEGGVARRHCRLLGDLKANLVLMNSPLLNKAFQKRKIVIV